MVNFLSQNFTLPFPQNINSKNYSNQVCPDQWVCEIEFNIINNKWIIDRTNNFYICKRRFNNNYSNIIDIDYSNIQKDNYLILVLESPHIDEYNTNTHIAFGPAQGKTGCNIEKYLEDVILKSNNLFHALNKNLRYKVVLLNSIQYQTSLGTLPLDKKIRNSNWRDLWNNIYPNNNFNNKVDFIKRINEFVKNNNNKIYKTIETTEITKINEITETTETTEKHKIVNSSLIICNLCTGGKVKNSLKQLVSLELNNNKIYHLSGQHPSSWYNPKNRIIQ